MPLDEVAQVLKACSDEGSELFDGGCTRGICPRENCQCPLGVGNVHWQGGDGLILALREDDAVRHHGEGVRRF